MMRFAKNVFCLPFVGYMLSGGVCLTRFVYPCLVILMPLFSIFALADDTSFGIAVSIIDSIQDRVPDDDDFFRICSDLRLSLTPQERAKVFGKIVFSQNPNIQREALLAIYEAKRNSLNDCKISYTNEVFQHSNNGEYDLRCESKISFVFAFSKNQLFLDRVGKRWATDSEHLTISYDNSVLRFVREPESDLPNADVSDKISFKFFYERYMPLYAAMLFNVSRCGYSPELSGFDMIDFLKAEGRTHVFQQQKDVNGVSCLVVLDTGCRIFLDPQKDFSVMRYEQFVHEFDPNAYASKRLVGRSLQHRMDNHQLVEYNNGIWLPTKIEHAYFVKDKKIGQVITTVTDVQINKGIPDSFFSDVIPDNAFVADGVRKMTYFQSDRASIECLLKETAKSKRIWIFQYISVTIGILLILIWITVKYLAYRKRKKSE